MVNIRDLDPDESPSASFGVELRSSRESQGFKQTQFALLLAYSNSHISAVETGRKLPTLRFARAADKVLRTGTKFERLCREVRHQTMLEGFPEYVRYEGHAREIRLFESGIIPGLLQTREYAAELAQAAVDRGVITEEQAAERVDFLTERQAAIARTPPPVVQVVLDESCLRREVGGPGLMGSQLRRLVEFARLPNTTLQVTPYSVGARRAFDLPVRLLTLPDRSMIGYAESQFQGHLDRDGRFVEGVLAAYYQLQNEALSQTASVAMIEQVREGTP
ncbi:helix-turn-helix transcriptional regulator [Streptomyces sp. AM 2-1-1]|uniref:helix-turn-helix domain-containing protein n=1 Tax=Streptomyces sp. AM 2-1-1 TaxID=3028709 RepID=UPI0023B8F79E|nr:helix-turn-helix transcriptional regulator [Streptomyces sp. AM 2-1-1]WEH41936.1 helix-turn-helix transcriptional regulator [Streptomyces sp. AM 2-1-1]